VKVLFVNYHHLNSNSGIHIFNLAAHLTRLGVECVACVPSQKEAVAALGEANFEVADITDFHRSNAKRGFDLIHAWTPRQVVRKMTQDLLRLETCPYIVHLEDNEEALMEVTSVLPARILGRLPTAVLDVITPSYASHPRGYKAFLAKASAITVIMESLMRFCPVDLPCEVIWAGYQEDLDWGMPPVIGERQRLGIADTDMVVAYTGNVHAANRAEVASLYLAIAQLQQRGFPVKLIRTGTDYVPLLDPAASVVKHTYCKELGHVPRGRLPALLSIADVLVQPGKPGPFNDYRFPSKLPEYLASGKPVILPRANIGLYLKDKEECLLLDEGSVDDIAQKLEFLWANQTVRATLGNGGRRFAEQHLQWGDIAAKLHAFYRALLNKAHSQ
jgi:glycosyltransferase involved in cell wall biosynthesis